MPYDAMPDARDLPRPNHHRPTNSPLLRGDDSASLPSEWSAIKRGAHNRIRTLVYPS
jgi:hypothetical protein